MDDVIPVRGYKKQILKSVAETTDTRNHYPRQESIPPGWQTLIKMTPSHLRFKYGVRIDKKYKHGTARCVVERVAEIDNNDELRCLCNHNIIWDAVTKIEKLDEPQSTYDIEVNGTHNFVANGLIVHNSEMVTIRYPVWRMERNPELRVIIGAYNDDLATLFSRKARKIAAQRFDLSQEKASASDWETLSGGGMRAAGVGVGVTGRGAHLIVIDDPVKNREEANSRAYRDRVWDWWKDDLYTRLEPEAAMILIMTRWHEFDLAGRILTSDFAADWTVINFPALATEADALGRQPGEALCPDRFDEKALTDIRRVLGNSFYALYQQTPMPPEGDFFKRSWFEILPALPAGPYWWVRYWDFAATEDAGDWTAGVLMGLHKTRKAYVIADVQHGQWDSEERNAVIRQTAALDRTTYGDVQVWREREPGSSGVDAAKAFVQMLRGYPAFAERVTGSKETRAEPVQSQAMVGNVALLAGVWNKPFLDELAGFPFSNDDQVDGMSGAFRRLGALERREEGKAGAEAPAAGDGQYLPAASTSFRGRL